MMDDNDLINAGATGEFKLEHEGFVCPQKYVNDFTPSQYEEMVEMFQTYDVDKSRTIDVQEIRKLLSDLDMGHQMDEAMKLMQELDTDGSGEMDWDEFCEFFSRIVRGDTSLRGFAKLTEQLNETPVSMLAEQAKKRDMEVGYKLLEERVATSMHAAHYVLEVTMTGTWFGMKDGKPSKYIGPKKFQGIGKTTRDAKFKAANNALTKLQNQMPGLAFAPGEIPEKWMQWVHENLGRGVDEAKVLRSLCAKGFQPSFNMHLMQSLMVGRHLKRALEKQPLLFAGEELGVLNDELDLFLDQKLRLGFDGNILLTMLQQFGFDVERNPEMVQRLRRQEVRAGTNWRAGPFNDPMQPNETKVRDFHQACAEGDMEETELYILAGQPIDERKDTPAGNAKTGLMMAAANGQKKVCKLLLQHHAMPNRQDASGRTALHWAALGGHVDTIRCLDKYGGDVHALDGGHNSPLHLAAGANKPDAADALLLIESDYQRRVVTGAIRASERATFNELIAEVFEGFLERKVHRKDMPRFRKDWLFEGALWVYDQFDADKRRFCTQPNQNHCEYILAAKDPDPHAGYYFGPRGHEVWVGTVETLDHLQFLLTEVFRVAACHQVNKLARTPLHVACFENLVDSHEQVIDLMINKHAFNMELQDMHGRRAFDELVVRRGRPGTPEGTELRESLVTDHRDELIAELLERRRQEELELMRRRHARILYEATAVGVEMNRELWEMTKLASNPRFRLDPYVVYEDSDTLNYFYVKKGVADDDEDGAMVQAVDAGAKGGDDDESTHSSSSSSSSSSSYDSDDNSTQSSVTMAEAAGENDSDDDDGGGKLVLGKKTNVGGKSKRQLQQEKMEAEAAARAFEELNVRFNWERPIDFEVRQRIKLANETVRNRGEFLRSVGVWDMILDRRLQTEWWCHSSTSEARFSTPAECRFPALLEKSSQRGHLGVSNEWNHMVDEHGNEYFHKPLTADFRWERPPDAMKLSNIDRCTRLIYGSKRIEQNWYSAEGLTEYVRAMDPAIDRFKACMPCAKKLLREIALFREMGLDAHLAHNGMGLHSSMLKFVRSSKASCMVYMIPQFEPAGAREAAKLKEMTKSTGEYNTEHIRRMIRRREQPCVLACVPSHHRDGSPKRLRSWNLCRRRKTSEIIFGWMSVHDPEPQTLLEPGAVVLARKRGNPVGWHSAVVKQRGGNNTYVVSFSATESQRDVPRSDIDADGPVFWWNGLEGKSQWEVPDEVMPFEAAAGAEHATAMAKEGGAAARLRGRKAGIALMGEDSTNLTEALSRPTSKEAGANGGKGGLEDVLLGEDGDPLEGEAMVNHLEEERQALEAHMKAEEEKMAAAIAGESSQERKVMVNTRSRNKRSSGNEGGAGAPEDKVALTVDERNAAEKKRNEQMAEAMAAAQDVGFMTKFSAKLMPENVPFPWLDGREWVEDLVPRCGTDPRRFDLAGWDEFVDPDTGVVFYRNRLVADMEEAARMFQKLYRTKRFKPTVEFWESRAFTFYKPPEVTLAQHERTGWGIICRRSHFKREHIDEDDRVWHELLDTVSGDLFYHNLLKGWSQWEMPPAKKGEQELRKDDRPLNEGDACLFRFVESVDDVECTIAKVRSDPDTGERMYDVVATDDEELKQRWVKRFAIKAAPLTREQMNEKREARNWRLQLLRAREADERRWDSERRLKSEAMRRARRGGRLMKALVALTDEEVENYREDRSELERKQREDKLVAAQRAEVARAAEMRKNANRGKNEALEVLSGERDGGDISSDDEEDELGAMVKIKGGMTAEEEEAMREAKQKMDEQRKKRDALKVADAKEKVEREAWLSSKEDHVTSPRTQRRRVVHRNMHRALMRQRDHFIICRWGCGQWMREGQEEYFHQKEVCAKRIVGCVLGCPMKMREEQWLELYVPPELRPVDSDDERDDESVLSGVERNVENVQQHHEENECPRRLVACPRHCGEWTPFEDMKVHMDEKCVKRPFPPLKCRLGCGLEFTGGVHRMLQCEEERLEHEQEMCEFRIVRCTWKGCASTFPANQRTEHRRKHIIASGILVYTVPGSYKYVVPSGCRQLKVQLWGGGGGSGHLIQQLCGSGGGGGFVEALLTVRPGDRLEVTVGAGGRAGTMGSRIQTTDPADPSSVHVEDVVGTAAGGHPGGGDGFSTNMSWAAGGGGGYSMVQRVTGGDGGYAETMLVASAGGGGGSRDGVPGGGEHGELPGTKLDKLNGRMGTQEKGGASGDSGEGLLCEFGAEAGDQWKGGNGASFGAGGGGGYFGGGGGGVAPGIVGGGGGGSSFANHQYCNDVVFLQGDSWIPGGCEGDGYAPPDATGYHELDKVGGKVGEGGQRSKAVTNAGRNGCIRIYRPSFYEDHHPDRNKKPYIGHPRRQEMLLPIGKPVAQVLDEAEAAAEARKNPVVKMKKKEYR